MISEQVGAETGVTIAIFYTAANALAAASSGGDDSPLVAALLASVEVLSASVMASAVASLTTAGGLSRQTDFLGWKNLKTSW